MINQVTFIPELEWSLQKREVDEAGAEILVPKSGKGVIATCSFDCNVYMWSKQDCDRVGSLILGTGLAMSSGAEQTVAEQRKYSNIWKIRINIEERRIKDRIEAEDRLQMADAMNYDSMFIKGNKD